MLPATEVPSIQTNAHPLAQEGTERMFLGHSRHGETGYRRRLGEIWIVRHQAETEWVAVCRLDPRDKRTVHLERLCDGAAWAEAIRWAGQTFALRSELTLVATSAGLRSAPAEPVLDAEMRRSAAA